MTARDELALELFIGDNFKQPRESSIQDWEYFHAEHTFLWRTEHYKAMAEHALAAGYRKPRQVTTTEELDALPVGSVLLDVDGDVCQRFRGGWRATVNERNDDPRLSDTLEVDLPATVLHEGGHG